MIERNSMDYTRIFLNISPEMLAAIQIFAMPEGQFQETSTFQPVTTLSGWQATQPLTVSIPQIDIAYLKYLDLLQRCYTLRGKRTEILRFLESFPFLVPLLVRAYIVIQTYFPQTLVFLAVMNDPDESDADQIVVSIATHLHPEEAIERLDAFDQQWWLESAKQADGKLCVLLEFR